VVRKQVLAFVETGAVPIEIQGIAEMIEEMVKSLDVYRIGNRSLSHLNAAARDATRKLPRSFQLRRDRPHKDLLG